MRHSRHVMNAYIRLDVHSENAFVTVLDQDGRVAAQKRIVNEHVPNFLRLFNLKKVGLKVCVIVQ